MQPPQPSWIARRLAAEQGRLALWLPVAMGAGILLYFQLRFEPPLWWALPALAPLPAALWLARRSLVGGWALGLVAAAGLGVALCLFHAARAPPPLDPPRGAVVLTGVVAETDLLPEGVRLTLSGARWDEAMAPTPRLIRVRLRANDPVRPQPGDTVRLRTLLRAPSAPAYPGAWDFQRAAFFEGLGASGFALGPAEILGEGARAPPLAGWRAAIEARVIAAVPGGAGAIAAALLTGGQSAIARADMEAMRDSGLVHLLSVSGLHIAIVMGVSFFVVRAGLALWPGFALRFGTRPWAALAALAAGGFYMVLTGAQIPMQRSFAMAALVTLALLTGRRAFSPRVLAFAAAAVLALHPFALMGPSFQMSFAAVLALIAVWERLRPVLARGEAARPWWWLPVAAVLGTALTSLVAGLATTPYGLHHFGRVQLYGVAANALAVPLTSVLVMPSGMLALALMPLGLEALPLWLMGRGVEGILLVAREVASWPGAAATLAPLPGWGLGLASLGLLWLCLWRTGWRLWGLPLLGAGLLAWGLARPPDALAAADGRLFAFAVEGELHVERRPGASRFTRELWLRSQGDEEGEALPAEGEAAGGRIRCTPEACTLHDATGAARVLLLRPAPPRRGQRAPPLRAPPEACGAVAVILAPEPLRGGCPGSQLVDRFALWRDGAHAVWLTGAGARVLSDRAHRGERPWVPPRPLPRGEAVLPPAPTE
ncbi:ComEC/Rec2 family competence protein [Rubritepida flocculans]|uniref:ComEC/Rec2 family competence protein n=1 Tax=Rubritepida flocculans TaxID=182403 RepID=UPI0004135539|nr:ComEC/Rec2 family competence protein [Rubritepida flocculans]